MILQIERGSTRSHSVGNWLWKGLWTDKQQDDEDDGLRERAVKPYRRSRGIAPLILKLDRRWR